MESTVLELLHEQGKRLNDIERLLTLSKTVLNLDEVCWLIGLSKSHVYKLTSGGKIPHFKQSKHLFFDRVEIESWLKSNRIYSLDELENTASSTLSSGKKGGLK